MQIKNNQVVLGDTDYVIRAKNGLYLQKDFSWNADKKTAKGFPDLNQATGAMMHRGIVNATAIKR